MDNQDSNLVERKLSDGDNGNLPQYPHKLKMRNDIIDEIIEKPVQHIVVDQNLEGAINVGFIFLFFISIQSIITMIQQFGWPQEIILRSLKCVASDSITLIMINSVYGLSTIYEYLLIKLLISSKIKILLFRLIHYPLIICFIFSPMYLMHNTSPFIKMVGYMQILVFALKIQSYFSTNHLLYLKKTKKFDEMMKEYNEKISKKDKKISRKDSFHTQERILGIIDPSNKFPNNINLKNFYYFILFAPTLVYELQFPRTTKIRWFYLFKQFVQAILLFVIMMWLMSTYISPSFKTHKEIDFLFIMKISFHNMFPNFLIWIISFYIFFHCILNIICELTYFGDRCFYLDWWNASSLTEFWRKWNVPVHEWALRHLYVDSIFILKMSESRAGVIVFIFSAILHEVIACFGFSQIKLYFFLGMLAQIQGIMIEKIFLKNVNKRIGNIFMWLNLILGQPFLIAVYMSEWYQKYYTDPCSIWCQKVPFAFPSFRLNAS